MRSLVRVCLTAGVLSLALLLAGCEDFDPTAIFDSEMFNTKKKLPGERRPVFPEGTPGVSQGVPPEMVKGYQAPAEREAAAKDAPKEAPKDASKQVPKEATAEPTEPKPKHKAKPKVVAKPAEQSAPSAAQPNEPSSQPSQSPASAPTQQAPVASRWPDSPQPSGGVAWPDPPAPH
jgi:outer membrane biosynthesis protein TonB